MKVFRIGLGVALLLSPIVAHADDTATCPSTPVAPPADLAGWATPVARDAAGAKDGLVHAGLLPGRADAVTLLPTPQVDYPLRPAKPASPESYGGLLRLVVAQPGTYRVALGSPAWLDLVTTAGVAVESVGHSHGPACTGIRKLVDFPLAPGAYILQISGNPMPATQVLVVSRP